MPVRTGFSENESPNVFGQRRQQTKNVVAGSVSPRLHARPTRCHYRSDTSEWLEGAIFDLQLMHEVKGSNVTTRSARFAPGNIANSPLGPIHFRRCDGWSRYAQREHRGGNQLRRRILLSLRASF